MRSCPHATTDEEPRLAETNAFVAELEHAGLFTVPTHEDGEPVYTPTAEGEQVAMSNADDSGRC